MPNVLSLSHSFCHEWYLLRLACDRDLRGRVCASSEVHAVLSLCPVINFMITQKA